jgi:hypothetical protein
MNDAPMKLVGDAESDSDMSLGIESCGSSPLHNMSRMSGTSLPAKDLIISEPFDSSERDEDSDESTIQWDLLDSGSASLTISEISGSPGLPIKIDM